MPKNKFQDVIFTIIMVFVMVYTMICYNIALNVGGMNNQVFLNAFHELVIMGPIAFILDFFLIGPFAKKKAFSIVNLERDNNFHLVIAISVVSIIGRMRESSSYPSGSRPLQSTSQWHSSGSSASPVHW